MNHHDPNPPMTMPQWRTAITHAIGRLHLTAPDEAGFRAQLRAANLEDVHLFDMHTDAHTVVRDEELAAATTGAHCKLSLQISGAASLSQDGRSCVLEPGDLALPINDAARLIETKYAAQEQARQDATERARDFHYPFGVRLAA